LQLWSASLIAFSNNPIIGVGTSDFINEYPRIARRHGFDPETQFFPHNTYIGLLAELGLFGGLSGLLLIAFVFVKGWQNVVKSSGSGLSVILLSLFLAQAAHMFFLSMFHARRLWFVFALIIGASLLIGEVIKNKDKGRTFP
ncbi:O-antigen ligase family protein, partial [Candidatus Bipolaricaulota bacterium]|nr:O-antigen ligase family protein [Candidatus Bipolaricaulota bacterium]